MISDKMVMAAQLATNHIRYGLSDSEMKKALESALSVETGKPLPAHVIAAAWGAWKSRNGGKLGPGPAFTEAIEAALRALQAGKEPT